MKRKKWLSILLVLVMAMTWLPMTVFAADETVTVNNGIWITPETTNEEIAKAWGEGVATIEESNGVYTVTLLKNITMTKATLPISLGVQNGGADQPLIVLDLNGCVITSNTTAIANYGNLTIKDSIGGGKALYNGDGYLSAVNNVGSTMTIEGGTFECQGAGSAMYNAAIGSASETVTVINDGTFLGNSAGALNTYGNVEINGGTFEGKYGVVSKQGSSGTGSVTFTENSTAVINAESMAFVVHGDGVNDGKISALGGTFNAPNIAGKLSNAVTTNDIKITGGSFTTSPADYVPKDVAIASFTDSGENDPAAYVVGANDIAAKAETAGGGDTIDILSGNVTFDIGTDGVNVSNSGGGNVIVNQSPVKENSPVTVCVHVWSNPQWVWAQDNSAATAVFTCTKDENHTEKVSATLSSAVKTEATCTAKGTTTYTAKVSFNGKEYTDTKDVMDINPISHNTVLTKAKAPTTTAAGNIEYWYCEGCNKYFSDEAGKDEINVADTVIPKLPMITEGANAVWTTGGKDGLSFTSNAEYSDFIKVMVDGKDLDAADYEVKAGSTVVTIKAAYLDTLSIGEHSLAIVSNNGTAKTTFAITAAKTEYESGGIAGVPPTGDNRNVILWILFMFVFSIGVLGMTARSRKKKPTK